MFVSMLKGSTGAVSTRMLGDNLNLMRIPEEEVGRKAPSCQLEAECFG